MIFLVEEVRDHSPKNTFSIDEWLFCVDEWINKNSDSFELYKDSKFTSVCKGLV